MNIKLLDVMKFVGFIGLTIVGLLVALKALGLLNIGD